MDGVLVCGWLRFVYGMMMMVWDMGSYFSSLGVGAVQSSICYAWSLVTFYIVIFAARVKSRCIHDLSYILSLYLTLSLDSKKMLDSKKK